MADEATTPSAAKRRMGVALKEAREAAGLSLDDAGRTIQRSAATLSRLERGRLQKPRVIEVRALLDHYGSAAVDDAQRDQILRLARQATEPAWFTSFRDVLGSPMTADDAQRYIEFESDASVIRTFEPENVPGLLQTEGYARAITDVFFPTYTTAQRARFVELRMARQKVFDRPDEPLRLEVIIGETALRRHPATTTTEVMREQLQALLAHAEGDRPNVTLRVAPIELGHPAVYGGPYVVMDLADEDENGLVYLETRLAPQFIQDDDKIDEFRGLHRKLVDAVLDPKQTQELLKEVIDELS